jgi:GNAT superfamily N-acetyltransferase
LRHILALDEHDRYLRFGYAANDEHIANYVAHLQFERDEIFGVYNRKLELIAMAHLAFNPTLSMKHQVEFGVSVAKKSRGKGLGAQLFERALLHARNEGATEMVIHALSENTAMLKIATNAGSRVVRDGSESEAHLTVPPATFASQVGELVDEHVGEFDFNFKMQAKNLNDLIHELTRPPAKAG